MIFSTVSWFHAFTRRRLTSLQLRCSRDQVSMNMSSHTLVRPSYLALLHLVDISPSYEIPLYSYLQFHALYSVDMAVLSKNHTYISQRRTWSNYDIQSSQVRCAFWQWKHARFAFFFFGPSLPFLVCVAESSAWSSEVSVRFRFGHGAGFFLGGAGAEGPARAFCIWAGLTNAGATGSEEGRGAYIADIMRDTPVTRCKIEGMRLGCHAKFPPDFYYKVFAFCVISG